MEGHRARRARTPFQVLGPSPLLHGWVWPFLWVLAVPAVTVPLHLSLLVQALPSCVLLDAGLGCPAPLVLLSLAPGLLNLVPFLWSRAPQQRTRTAALVAGTLGLLRLVTPVLLALVSGATVTVALHDLPGDGPNSALRLAGWFFSVGTESAAVSRVLWLLSVGVMVVFPWLARSGGPRRGGRMLQPPVSA
ncbi:MAG: hypothetical protein HY689_00755 [Chloroflexi bacterium]|nr:hypothetical protein [Chloroflexota bacterium]